MSAVTYYAKVAQIAGGTSEENMESAAAFKSGQAERRKEERKSKGLTPWVAEIIVHHNDMLAEYSDRE
jgi:hypothetical protein